LPEKLDVYFLSAPTTSLYYFDYLESLPKNHLVAENDKYKCIPMGDGCFHPQLGYMDISENEKQDKKSPPKKIKTINNYNVNLVECSKNESHFDLFCGQAKKDVKRKPHDLEIWIDISSSMKRIDYVGGDSDHCSRRLFLRKIKDICGDKTMTFLFNTSKKQMGRLSQSCMSYGMNDEDRLISWIKTSKAKNLVIVTDIDELSSKLGDFLDSIAANVHGVGTTGLSALSLPNNSKEFAAICR